jgi:hypothetical protein
VTMARVAANRPLRECDLDLDGSIASDAELASGVRVVALVREVATCSSSAGNVALLPRPWRTPNLGRLGDG